MTKGVLSISGMKQSMQWIDAISSQQSFGMEVRVGN
jgi:hypothetical protein